MPAMHRAPQSCRWARWPALASPLLLLLLLATRVGSAASDGTQDSKTEELGERFSCEGRAAGFYADISSGCQLYHMCDEGGRVFTHTCPERTLFQQRTMVCDHWYMVECSEAGRGAKAPAPGRHASPPPLQVQVVPLGGFPGRKRHSQRVIATFPYQRGNASADQSSRSSTRSPQDSVESFKISSLPNSTPGSVISSTATIERVERPAFYPAIPFRNVEIIQEREPPKSDRPAPHVTGRAKIERVFKESVLSSPGDAVISQVQYISPFREPKAEIQFASTTPRPTTEAASSLIVNKYNNNPFFESYFRTSYSIESPTSPRTVQTTTQNIGRREEEDDSENKLEIVIPDPRKMFYIPDSNYDPGDASKEGGTVLVIELPGKNAMKFQRVEVTEARNHDCPQCHPSFLLPGLCRPCVLIK